MENPSSSSGASAFPWKVVIRLAFTSHAEAIIARDTLSVDKELRPESLTRIERVEDKSSNCLIVEFHSKTLASLRVAVNSYIKSISLVCDTLSVFGHSTDQQILNSEPPLPDCAMKL